MAFVKEEIEESNEIDTAASCPVLLKLKPEYSIQLTNDSEQEEPREECDKIGDVAPCSVLRRVESDYLIESTSDREFIWLEENYEIDETEWCPALPEQDRLASTAQLTNCSQQNGTYEKRPALTSAQSSRQYRENLKAHSEQGTLSFTSQLSNFSQQYGTIGKRPPLTNAQRSKRYRERLKAHKLVKEKHRQAVEREKLLNGEECEEYRENNELIEGRRNRGPMTSAERTRAYRERLRLKKMGLKKPPQTNAERSRKYRERVKQQLLNDHLRKETNSTERTRAYRIRQKLKKLQNDNHEEISLVSSESSSTINESIEH